MSGYLGEKAHFLTEEGEQMQLGCVCVCVSIHPSIPVCFSLISETKIWGE